jgi:hypothetical protein
MRFLRFLREVVVLSAVAVVAPHHASAQNLERRITAVGDGVAQFTFAARAGVCGDGSTYVSDGFGGDSRIMENSTFNGRLRPGDQYQACLPGPVRVVATVNGGEVTRLRTYAGPLPARRDSARTDLGRVSVADALAFLSRIAERGAARVAERSLLPMVLADSSTPWPSLLRFARDESRPKALRTSAAFWLSRGAQAKLGVSDADQDDDDDVRGSVVFALSQQPRSQSVPQLIELARTSKHPAVRAQALFWLGQSGDARAVDLFEELLR